MWQPWLGGPIRRGLHLDTSRNTDMSTSNFDTDISCTSRLKEWDILQNVPIHPKPIDRYTAPDPADAVQTLAKMTLDRPLED